MNVYVDTSAFLAVLNRDDERHPEARAIWLRLLDEGTPMGTGSYVLVETAAILQNRLGLDAVRTFFDAVYPILEIVWVDAGLMALAVQLLTAANRKSLSLVDCCSFLIMQQMKVKQAFAFDRHFGERGFEVLKA